MVEQEKLLNIFKDCGALLQGHFLLTSGLHSPTYLQCARVCRLPDICGELCAELAEQLRDIRVDAVVGPALGGIVIAYELARAMGTRGIFMERDADGRMTLRRGFELVPGESVVVAEDVMTTGGSVTEIIENVEKAGATVAGVACLVDRGGARRFEGRRIARLLQMQVPTYTAEDCPQCRKGMELVKPGSRKQPGGPA